MDITIYPRKLSGTVHAIPSKSQAHRLLICAAFADGVTQLFCPQTNQDIEATADCLRSLGADIQRTADGYTVHPAAKIPAQAILNCHESGSTLRFMLPIAGALGIDATFLLAGRLPCRPLSPLWEEMERMGCKLSRPSENTLRCTGKLRSGNYTISGNVSSQFITGLLLAAALLDEETQITVNGRLESKPYVDMTCHALNMFGVNTENYRVIGCFPFQTPGNLAVEGDWSNGAFFLTASAIGNDITVKGLNPDSVQGDRAVVDILNTTGSACTISAANIPDLIPILSVAAAYHNGATFTDIQRLRLKESDRVATVIAMLNALGIRAEATEDSLTVFPGKFHGGIVDAANDHRIAMSAAIAATAASEPVTIIGAECVRKSYPSFWEEYIRLGGNYEQYIR